MTFNQRLVDGYYHVSHSLLIAVVIGLSNGGCHQGDPAATDVTAAADSRDATDIDGDFAARENVAAAEVIEIARVIEAEAELKSEVDRAMAMKPDRGDVPIIAENSVAETRANEVTMPENIANETPDEENIDPDSNAGSEPAPDSIVEPTSAADGAAEPIDPPAMRLLLPTTAGGLLVDLEIRIGEKSLADVFAQRIDDVIAEAREEDSAELTWPQLFRHVASDPQQFGRTQGVNENQYSDLTRRYDANRNKKPDHDEVARFLFRSSGFADPFRLSGTDYYRQINRSQSPLFHAIDANGNESLEPEELRDAAHSLMRLDENSDQGISLSEAKVNQPDNDPAWNLRRSNRRGEVAMDMEGYIDWAMVSYSLDAMVENAPFGIEHHPIAALDQDGNQSISREEAKALRTVQPDLKLLVQFAAGRSDDPSIQIMSMRPELESFAAEQETNDTISMLGPTLWLSARVVDARTGQDRIPPEAFAMLDVNGDGSLDETEIPVAAAEQFSFEKLDADDDGKLTLKEINDGMRGNEPIWNVQVRGRAAEFPDALFAWLDQDQDRFLSEREILAAGGRLRQQHSGALLPTDIPDSFVIQLVRGDPLQDAASFRFSHAETRISESLPRWARSMDSNRDGDISGREFIGTAEQFRDLDADVDGFIDQREVLSLGE